MTADTNAQAHTEATLGDLQAQVQRLETELRGVRTRRDNCITKAHQDGMSMYRIAQVIGISQQAVRHIIKASTKQ